MHWDIDVSSLAVTGVTRSEWLQSGFVTPSDVSLSWDDASRTLTVQPAATTFQYYHDGTKHTVSSAKTKQIDNQSGLWAFYFTDGTGAITATKNPSEDAIGDIIKDECIIAYVMWDATGGDGRLMPELHGYRMSPVTRHWAHDTIGSVYISGMALADFSIDQNGNSDAHAQFSVAAGEFYDENIELTLAAVTSTTGLEIWYLDGSDWRWQTNAGFSIIDDGSDLYYNNSGAQAAVNNKDFVLCHVFATNISDDSGSGSKYIAVQGQAMYTSRRNARAGAEVEINNLVHGTLPLQEIIPVATVIFQNKGSTGHGLTVTTDAGDNYVDWRQSNLKASGGKVQDHGSLAGLSDDDHQQYLLADGTRALTADWDAGSHKITAEQLESDVATGTAPLVVASTTVVPNLNADKLDGNDAADIDYAFVTGNDAATDVTAAELEELTDGSTTTKHSHSEQSSRMCEGRLTLTSGSPVTSANVTAATTLYFAPYKGGRIALYDGSSDWDIIDFSEISIAVPATTTQMYDVFIYNNGGTATLELTAWTNDTTRATALTTQDGVYVKTGATTRRYVGSFRTTGTSGQTEDSESSRFVWNYYNRVKRFLECHDATDTWTNTQDNTFYAANGSTVVGTARVEIVTGVEEDCVFARNNAAAGNSGGTAVVTCGIGIDATTTNSALTHPAISPGASNQPITAEYSGYPGIGYHYIQRIEASENSGTTTWSGDQGRTWTQTGLVAEIWA